VLPSNISINSGHNILQSHASERFYNVGLNGLISLRDFRNDQTNPAIRARRKALNSLNNLAASSADPFLKHAGQMFSEGLDLNLALQTSLSSITEDLSDRFPESESFSGGALALIPTLNMLKIMETFRKT